MSAVRSADSIPENLRESAPKRADQISDRISHFGKALFGSLLLFLIPLLTISSLLFGNSAPPPGVAAALAGHTSFHLKKTFSHLFMKERELVANASKAFDAYTLLFDTLKAKHEAHKITCKRRNEAINELKKKATDLDNELARLVNQAVHDQLKKQEEDHETPLTNIEAIEEFLSAHAPPELIIKRDEIMALKSSLIRDHTQLINAWEQEKAQFQAELESIKTLENRYDAYDAQIKKSPVVLFFRQFIYKKNG